MKKLLMCAALLGLSGGSAYALPVYNCAGTPTQCNGVELGAELFNLGSGNYRVDVAFDFTGYDFNATDRLHALQISGMVAGQNAMTNLSFAVVQGTVSGAFGGVINTGLNAQGCSGGGQNGLCVESTPANGGILVNGGNALVSFNFTTAFAVDPTDVHIKYQYVTSAGVKIGDLGSFDQPYSTCDRPTDPDCNPDTPGDVPEPTTMALLGLGLLSAGIARRRR